MISKVKSSNLWRKTLENGEAPHIHGSVKGILWKWPKALYSSNAVTVKISTEKRNILTETEKKCLKYLWIQKSSWINKAHLGGKNNAGGIALPEFKINCGAIVIKTVCYWHKTDMII